MLIFTYKMLICAHKILVCMQKMLICVHKIVFLWLQIINFRERFFFFECNVQGALKFCTFTSSFFESLQTNQKVTVHVNNEQSRNCCSSRGMTVFAVEIPARTKMVKTFYFVKIFKTVICFSVFL